MNSLKFRLTVLNFLEFAVWGAYLTSMGTYLAGVGLGSNIGWFYSVQGIVSIFMPALMGILADRWIEGQRVLSLCHALAGAFMIGASVYGYQAGESRIRHREGLPTNPRMGNSRFHRHHVDC